MRIVARCRRADGGNAITFVCGHVMVRVKSIVVGAIKRIVPLRTRNRVRLWLRRHPIEYRLRWPDLAICDLRKNDVVLDVGAHVGDFVECVLAHQPHAIVHAFEPIPEAFEVMRRKFGDYPGVRCHNVALGSERGGKPFNVSRYDQASSFLQLGRALANGVYGIDFTTEKTIHVPIVTVGEILTEYRLKHVKLLKLDVQGFELEVLKGTGRFLERVDYVYTEAQFQELYIEGPRFDVTAEFLIQRGFDLVRMTSFRTDDVGRLMECDMIFRRRTA